MRGTDRTRSGRLPLERVGMTTDPEWQPTRGVMEVVPEMLAP